MHCCAFPLAKTNTKGQHKENTCAPLLFTLTLLAFHYNEELIFYALLCNTSNSTFPFCVPPFIHVCMLSEWSAYCPHFYSANYPLFTHYNTKKNTSSHYNTLTFFLQNFYIRAQAYIIYIKTYI